MKKVLLVLFASLVFAGLASAAISFTDSSPGVSGSGPYTWTYTPTLNSGESITATVPGASCNVVSVECGSFFTIYDVVGYVAASAFAPANWSISVQLTGLTPSTVIPTDASAVDNITYYYTPSNPSTIVTGTGQALGSFGFESTTSAKNENGFYSYQTNSPEPPDQGDGHIPVPGSVPEPATLALIGGGLIGLAILRRKSAR